uniref:LIM zinc-binding domain-containing protein n=1 Tax=Ciona intestinalis TaxID=7719 RepID=H2XNM4_CIOIN
MNYKQWYCVIIVLLVTSQMFIDTAEAGRRRKCKQSVCHSCKKILKNKEMVPLKFLFICRMCSKSCRRQLSSFFLS